MTQTCSNTTSATYEHGGVQHIVIGGTLMEIYKELCSRLSVDGPRVLQAETPKGAIIRASLYPGDSCVSNALGRQLFRA